MATKADRYDGIDGLKAYAIIGIALMLYKAYLKLRKPAYYQGLLLSGKLDTVLADVEEQAAERYEVLIEQMSQREGVSEKLKEENQMEWVRRMRNLENRAAKIVKAELIYTFERR